MRARQKKKNYKKIHGYNPPRTIDYSVINEVMPRIILVVEKWISDVTDILNKTVKIIEEMPEEEFNEIISRSELTIEQVVMAKNIRCGRNKNQ